MNYNILKQDTLIITPFKHSFLSYIEKNKLLLNIKFMTLDEFIKLVFFDYDEKTIYYIMKNYNIGYYSSLEYIKSLYFCNKDIDNDKIKFLNELKDKLIKNNLLKFNKIDYKNIIVYGYDYIDSYYKEEFKKYNVEYINYDYKNYEINTVHRLNNIYDEVMFLSERIIDLINKGININNIKILNVNDEYEKEIRKVFYLNNIPLEDIKIYLYELPIIKEYLNTMDLSIFKDKDEVYVKLIDILNKYSWIDDLSKVKELIIEDLKKTSINKTYENEIKFVDINDINEDDYVFLINYHTNIPRIYTDSDYLDDKLKEKLCVDTSNIKNYNTRLELINKLKNIKNLTISCNKEEYMSNLLDDIEIKTYENNYSYSNKSNIYNLGIMLDEYYKYGTILPGLNKLYENYKNYKSYDNKYKDIDNNELRNYLNNKLLLSYTKLDSYYRCGFKYYINYVLKLDKYEETFKIFLGNISHYILSKCFLDNFDFEYEFNRYIEESNNNFSNKEKFFINKLKKELIFIIDTIKEQNKNISLNKTLYEKKICINNGNKTFEGIIDKLIYDDNNMAIIDYKTGNTIISLDDIEYGIGMQLPIYVYLSKNYFKDKNIAGFYLQHILNNNSVNKDISDKKNSLKLEGYSNSDINILEKLDCNYMDSNLIKGLKTTKNGFSAYSKILNNEEIENLRKISEDKINKCFDDVLNGKFNINPKIINGENVSCNYCKYKDLCYKTEKDNIYIER